MHNDYKAFEHKDIFNNLELPGTQTPLHKQSLKRALLEHGDFSRKHSVSILHHLPQRSFLFIRQYGVYSLAAIALFITIALWSIAPFTYPAFAHIIIEVNPSLKLTIDTNNNVIDFIALDQTAKNIFGEKDFRRKKAELAIEEILNILHEKSLLEKHSNVMLVVSPVQEDKFGDIAQTISKTEMTVHRRLSELEATAGVRTFALQTKVYSAAERAGLLPSRYMRLLDYGMTSDTLKELFYYADDPEIDKDYFVDNFEEIAEQITEVLDRDVPENETVLVIKEALTARRRGEIRRAVRRLNELLDEDMEPKAAAARIRDEMRSRRKPIDVDERQYENEYPEDIDDVYDKAPLEDEIKQPSGNEENRRPNERINERHIHLNERRERLQERRQQQMNEGNELPEEEPDESKETSDDIFEQYNEKQEHQDIRQNRQNIRQQQDIRRERRNERLMQLEQKREQQGEDSDDSKETSEDTYEQSDTHQEQHETNDR